ncbi:hypothetical protein AB1Y20_006002 [Prymnesium parvum]|uniref:Uncharacterized protein n=1 Tax=Prymnesium parvum TaxID=97485 RepID=A0AB34J190_PRYPA
MPHGAARSPSLKRPRSAQDDEGDEGIEEWIAQDNGTFRRVEPCASDLPAPKRAHAELDAVELQRGCSCSGAHAVPAGASSPEISISAEGSMQDVCPTHSRRKAPFS